MAKNNETLDILKIFQREIKKVESTLEQIDEFYSRDLRWMDRFSDRIAEFGGSWKFIIGFMGVILAWLVLNTIIFVTKPIDPFPFILLNLLLSMLAALQAPVILMAQNRAAKRDQARVELDLEKDLRDLHIDQSTHTMLVGLKKDVGEIKKKLNLK
ncbi:DUF1003 domain-containing protein [Candidatus Woesearchaeota archaeon]|nr:DUF1003 domain-containing protein [Candidatus Woesearchaeota archaeon]